MKICIVGCAGLGSVITAPLARLSDVGVYVNDVSKAHMSAIRHMVQRRLRLHGQGKRRVKSAYP